MKRLAVLAAILLASACRQSIAGPEPVLVTLESSRPSASRGDTVTFTVSANGNNLVGVVIDYGDALTDGYAMGGALTARVTFKHAFGTSGNFTVRATVTDAIMGEKEATVGVVVN